MTDCKWHSRSGDVCTRSGTAMEGMTSSAEKKTSVAMSSPANKLQTPSSVLDGHQEFYQAYLNKIIRSAQKTHGERIVKFEGEKGASINFKLLLEHAMAGMKRDRDILTAEDLEKCVGNDAIDSPMFDTVSLLSPNEKNRSRDGKAQRPPCLAATHPASYQPKPQHAPNTMPPPTAKRIKLEPHIKLEPKSSSERRQPMPLYQQIHDPNYLTSREPVLDNPMFRHLNSDTMANEPSVISPTFMIALPLGTLTEGAIYWPIKETQPRDPHSA